MRPISSVLYQHLLRDLDGHLSREALACAALDMPPPPDIEEQKQIASYQLARSLLKKYQQGASTKKADAEALSKFLRFNQAQAVLNAEHRDGTFLEKRFGTSPLETLHGVVKYHVYNFFYPQGDPLIESFDQIASRGRPGPGSSFGARGQDFYTKMFDSQLSATSGALYKAYEYHTRNFPIWAAAETLRSHRYGEVDVVEGNKLCFVPKNVDISRVIAVEPSLNMFFQLGIGDILTERLKSYFRIDLSKQPDVNREYARLGSLGGSWDFSTIDLESASDSLTYETMKDLIPSDQFAWFDLFRSDKMRLPDGSSVSLEMLSTMGNGYTFPLQTVIFASIVRAVYDMEAAAKHPSQFAERNRVAVFGDDIIVRGKHNTHRVMALLKAYGFVPNPLKSFVEGSFRESCGHDYQSGRFIRGIYIKSLDTREAVFVAINRLNEWSAYTGVSLTSSVGYLVSFTQGIYDYVPCDEADDAGVRVPFSMLPGSQRDQNGAILYRKRCPIPVRLRVVDAVIKSPRGTRGRQYNPDGLLMAFLRGDIRNESISVRQDRVRYSTKRTVTPNWDRPNSSWGRYLQWRPWETAVHLNLVEME